MLERPRQEPSRAAPQLTVAGGPVPPDLHWALVLLIGLFCSIFQIVWLFIEASFVKKIKPESNFLTFLISGVCIQFASIIFFYVGIFALAAATGGNNNPPEGPLMVFIILLGCVVLGGIVLQFVGLFKMRDAIQEYYNTVEPINLRLSGVMTFFFAVFYFQYHFSRIAAWKKTGYLTPQQ